MAKYCPKCGKEHINNEEYCLDCHTKLPDEKIELQDKAVDIFSKKENNTNNTNSKKNNASLGNIFTYERSKISNPNKTNKEKKKKKSKIFNSKAKKPDFNFNFKIDKRGLIVIAGIILLILIINYGVILSNEGTNTNETSNNTYNFSAYSISIPDGYTQADNNNYMAVFNGENVSVKLYNMSLNEGEEHSVDSLISAITENVEANQEGSLIYSDYINVSGTTGYNITYYEYDNITRDIGFIVGDMEYDIIFTTDSNDTSTLNSAEAQIIPTVKIKQ